MFPQQSSSFLSCYYGYSENNVEFYFPIYLRKWNILAFRWRVLSHFGLRPTRLTDLFSSKTRTVKCRRWSQDVTDFSRPTGVSHIPFARLELYHPISTRKSEYPLLLSHDLRILMDFACASNPSIEAIVSMYAASFNKAASE